jgi:serine phosphatase RsbU (regulator of sigma subunit)
MLTAGDNDLLVAFSDGLSEATNAGDEEFGSKRVFDAVAAHLDRPTEEVLARVLESARVLCGSEPLRDDLCLLVVRARAAVAGS